jgi:hypothetical protein
MTARERSRDMASHESLAALRRADPRKHPDYAIDVRASAALEQSIMATGPASSGSRRSLWRRTPRRRLTLIAVAGAIILLGGTAAYGELRPSEPTDLKPVPTPPPIDAPAALFQSKGFMDWQQYHDEYDAWTHKIELPPGSAWRGCDPAGRVPDAGGRSYSFYVGAGALDAVWEGMGQWTRDWIAAANAGNAERATRAEAWVVALRALLLTGNDGTRDALDKYTSKLLDSAIAEAREGHFGKLSRMVLAYTIPWSAYAEPAQPHAFPARRAGWTAQLDGPAHAGLDEAAMAALTAATAADTSQEYRQLLKWIGLPPGVTLAAPAEGDDNELVVGDGFVAAFEDARTAWWREWVAADEAGDQERVAAASAASAHLRKLLPIGIAVDPFELKLTLDPASLSGFEFLDDQAQRGDLRGIREWLEQQDADH